MKTVEEDNAKLKGKSTHRLQKQMKFIVKMKERKCESNYEFSVMD